MKFSNKPIESVYRLNKEKAAVLLANRIVMYSREREVIDLILLLLAGGLQPPLHLPFGIDNGCQQQNKMDFKAWLYMCLKQLGVCGQMKS